MPLLRSKTAAVAASGGAGTRPSEVMIARAALERTLRGRADERDVSTRPARDVGEGVVIGGQPCGRADEVGDGLRLDLGKSSAGKAPETARLRPVVEKDVPELVGEGLGGLGLGEVRTNRDTSP